MILNFLQAYRNTTITAHRRLMEQLVLAAMPVIPVSLAENESINLPLNGPIHVHITIPFSLLVKDFDPKTTQVPPRMKAGPWWRPTWLFGYRYETPTHPEVKAFDLTSPAFRQELWPKLSVLLFGKEEVTMYSVTGCDIQDWEHAAASNIVWSFATGVTDDNVDRARAVVLKLNNHPSRPGLFTVEELEGAEDAAWKKVLMDTEPWEETPEESAVDVEMTRRNRGLYQYMRDRDVRPSDEKGFVEKGVAESD
ncbi:uncharacterized protein B0H64DRAFT_478334 [Chaetomium fimeti]|uniref:Uncharacterized protein n=1 Tax=Chaetomium fimeti TaxID=1854472 RepID=A0AAE0H7V0_9PEZI|nr:hypothetical protein B0H64DRAFT_478334 [Chaetomium fimeti]